MQFIHLIYLWNIFLKRENNLTKKFFLISIILSSKQITISFTIRFMKNINQYKSILKKSLGGLFLIFIGLVAMYYFIYLTIEDSKLGNSIYYSFKGILISPALFVMGVYVLAFTDGGKFSIQDLSSREKRIFYFALFVGFVFGFLALYFVNNNLEIYGYDTSNL